MIKRIFWRELGIMYFSIVQDTGQSFEFAAPIREFTRDSPTATVVVAGRFRGENRNRDPIEWPALPARTEGGIAFPGMHRLTALEDNSVYACVCALPHNLTEVTPDMYKLDHRHLPVNGETVFGYADGYRAVIVMSGRVMDQGSTLIHQAGEKIDVPVGGQVSLLASEAAHTVGYRQTGG